MVICSSCPQPPSQNIDFDKLKWGSFTKQFEAFKRQNPSSSIHDLDGFADFVLSHPDKFKKTTAKRARFYKNVIEKKGGLLYQKDNGNNLIFDRSTRTWKQSDRPTFKNEGVAHDAFDTYDRNGIPRPHTDGFFRDGKFYPIGGGYGMPRIPRPTGGESKGFFGNIARAFETSWNKKPTEQEKPILKGIFDSQKFLTDKLITPLAPPVGYVANKQREFLQDKYLGQGLPMKRHL